MLELLFTCECIDYNKEYSVNKYCFENKIARKIEKNKDKKIYLNGNAYDVFFERVGNEVLVYGKKC